MRGGLLIFAAIFIVAITGLCGGVVLFALHRASSASSTRWRRVKAKRHSIATYRAPKTVH